MSELTHVTYILLQVPSYIRYEISNITYHMIYLGVLMWNRFVIEAVIISPDKTTIQVKPTTGGRKTLRKEIGGTWPTETAFVGWEIANTLRQNIHPLRKISMLMNPKFDMPHIISDRVKINLIRSPVSLLVRDGAIVANPAEDVDSRDFHGDWRI